MPTVATTSRPLHPAKATTEHAIVVSVTNGFVYGARGDEKETRRCTSIISNLMKFARQEKTHREPVDINRMVEDAMAIVDHQLTINKVRIEMSLAEDLPKIMGNANQLQQVLMNFAINAQQAMDGKGRVVKVVTRSLDAGHNQIVFSDTGPGIHTLGAKMVATRILVVDDDECIRDRVAQVLCDEGYEVSEAASGEQALELFKNDAFGLVITDILMGGMDGIALVEAIKQHNPNAHVIIITSYASMENAVAALKAGAYDYLQKPFEDLELIVAIGELIMQNIREADIAARYGGEEFVVLLPETSPSQAFELAERIRQVVAGQFAKGETNEIAASVTVSIGVATLGENINIEDSSALVDAADHAVYQAKAQGRNCVCRVG